jgi:hypothetical protein
MGGRDGVGGAVTRYGLDGPEFEIHWRQDFTYKSIQTRRPTPVYREMGTGSLSRE